jgi:hypothetical protein
MNDPIQALECVCAILADQRFAGTDQNPSGIRDLLWSATQQAKSEIERLRDELREAQKHLVSPL